MSVHCETALATCRQAPTRTHWLTGFHALVLLLHDWCWWACKGKGRPLRCYSAGWQAWKPSGAAFVVADKGAPPPTPQPRWR